MNLMLVHMLFVRVAIGATFAHLVPVGSMVVRDAESNWLKGAFLLLVHGVLAVAILHF